MFQLKAYDLQERLSRYIFAGETIHEVSPTCDCVVKLSNVCKHAKDEYPSKQARAEVCRSQRFNK